MRMVIMVLVLCSMLIVPVFAIAASADVQAQSDQTALKKWTGCPPWC